MKKHNLFALSLITLCTLVSCSGPKIMSPCENQGLEGNASNDQVKTQSVSELKTLLLEASKVTHYSYEVTSTITGYENHFIDYFTPYAWFEERDSKDQSFGYAMTSDEGYMFKYYLSEDKQTIYPSIYEYGGYDENSLTKVQGLYSAFTLAHISMLKDNMSTFDAVQTGINKFAITDSNIASVFQYLTTYGTSLISIMTGVYIEVIDYTALTFRAIVEAGSYGAITALFTPLNETPIDHVNEQVENGTLVGVDSHQDTTSFFDLTAQNNYVLSGIKTDSSTGEKVSHPYTIHCTNSYFYLSYNDGYENYKKNEYGYALVPKNTEVTYYVTQEDGSSIPYTQTLDYDACYGFKKDSNGEFYFNFFKGPVETTSTNYIEVDALPEEGIEGVLYIISNESGEKEVYEWAEVSEGQFDFMYYSTWPNSVGDFYINDASATFYLSGTPLTSIGKNYFEKDLNNENKYYSTDNGIISTLANGLFGWGFQATTTWMDYAIQANLTIEKNGNTITGGNIGLYVVASVNGGNEQVQSIYYTISDFGNGNVSEIEEFLKGIGD